MSDLELLLQFNRQAVTPEMVDFLAATTESIIHIKQSTSLVTLAVPPPPIAKFIRALVRHSNVQTPTLMASAVYLAKLRAIMPANVYGIETTRHRIFLGCLVLAAKTLNDSSPLNKHWAKYTDGLLTTREVNTIERELLEYFDWNVMLSTADLTTCLQPLLRRERERRLRDATAREAAIARQNLLLFNSPTASEHRRKGSSNGIPSPSSTLSHGRSDSNYSLPSLASTASLASSVASRRSARSSNIVTIPEELGGYSAAAAAAVGGLDNKENLAAKKAPARPFMVRRGLAKIKPISTSVDSASSWASSFFN
ncbi:cyclin [Maudiozyma humilis]|uniref:Cyclin n=1 Tax=Maudiozyma humilis TaxID=51915 RepID=A0AAV5RVE1_MAUHU|nr:cyclin [Kazachstania humilis]